MSDARKTPKEIRQENRRSWWSDIGNVGRLLGAALAATALLGACGAFYVKWNSVVVKAEAEAMHIVLESHSITRDKAQSTQINVLAEEVGAHGDTIDGVAEDVTFLKCYLTAPKRSRDRCGFK